MKITVNRQYYNGVFDLIKGYAMISIVLYHTSILFRGTVQNYITGRPILIVLDQLYYQLPMLMNSAMVILVMISGFGFRKAGIWATLKKQAKLLLVPYIITAFFVEISYLFIHYFFMKEPGTELTGYILEQSMGYLCGSINETTVMGQCMCETGPVWFLGALFISWNIMNILFHVADEKVVGILSVIITVAGYYLGQVYHPLFFLSQGMMFTGYLYIGYMIREKQLLLKKHPWPVAVLIGIGAFISTFFGFFGMAGYVYKLGFFEVIGAGCMAYALLYIAVAIDEIDGETIDNIRTIGRYSLWIMCCHTVENKAIPWYILTDQMQKCPPAAIPFVVLIKGCLIYGLYRIVKRVDKIRRKIRRKWGKWKTAEPLFLHGYSG